MACVATGLVCVLVGSVEGQTEQPRRAQAPPIVPEPVLLRSRTEQDPEPRVPPPVKAEPRAGANSGDFTPLKIGAVPFDANRASGIPEGVRPIVLDLKQACRLARVSKIAPQKGTKAERLAILDPKALDAEAVRVGADDFAGFRQRWLAQDAIDATTVIEFLDLVQRLRVVELAMADLAMATRVLDLYKQYAKGESSGIAQIQVNDVAEYAQRCRGRWFDRETAYRDALDEFKVHLGLPPEAPIVVDRSLIAGFDRVFEELDRWAEDDGRTLEAIEAIFRRMPRSPEFVIDGLSTRDQMTGDVNVPDGLMPAVDRRAKDDRQSLRNRKAVRRFIREAEDGDLAMTDLYVAMGRRSRDQDRIVMPPAASDAGATATNQAVVTMSLLKSSSEVRQAEERSVAAWSRSHAARLDAYLALGVLPFDGWDAFLASFSTAPKKP